MHFSWECFAQSVIHKPNSYKIDSENTLGSKHPFNWSHSSHHHNSLNQYHHHLLIPSSCMDFSIKKVWFRMSVVIPSDRSYFSHITSNLQLAQMWDFFCHRIWKKRWDIKSSQRKVFSLWVIFLQNKASENCAMTFTICVGYAPCGIL